MFRQELSQLSVFQGLPEDQFEMLVPLLELRCFAKDEIIFEQGQQADDLYILLTGHVVVRYKPYDGPPLTVAHIAPGGVFGWSAAMMREVYSSMALSVSESEVYCVNGQKLRTLCECNPELGTQFLERLAGVITERLQSTHAQIVNILTQGMDLDGDCDCRTEENGRK